MMLHGIRCVVQRKKGQKEINNTAEAATPAVAVFFFILLNSSSLSLSNIAIRSTKKNQVTRKVSYNFNEFLTVFLTNYQNILMTLRQSILELIRQTTQLTG